MSTGKMAMSPWWKSRRKDTARKAASLRPNNRVAKAARKRGLTPSSRTANSTSATRTHSGVTTWRRSDPRCASRAIPSGEHVRHLLLTADDADGRRFIGHKRAQRAQKILDCGGKRSATPLWHDVTRGSELPSESAVTFPPAAANKAALRSLASAISSFASVINQHVI